jgi:acyl carrier protein phosphodiesterase
MNHLAHCYLSFGNEDHLVGNFMGDDIKGNDWQQYPAGIQKGILIHRQIDAFTDAHPLTHIAMDRIRPWAGRYSGPIYDILCDHLLTRCWADHVPEQSLDAFADSTYAMLNRRQSDLLPQLQERLPRMIAGDFLRGYGNAEHLLWIFNRFGHRLRQPVDWPALLSHFMADIEVFQKDFDVFFPELKAHIYKISNSTQQ